MKNLSLTLAIAVGLSGLFSTNAFAQMQFKELSSIYIEKAVAELPDAAFIFNMNFTTVVTSADAPGEEYQPVLVEYAIGNDLSTCIAKLMYVDIANDTVVSNKPVNCEVSK